MLTVERMNYFLFDQLNSESNSLAFATLSGKDD
jgi:hypothetical protein